MFVEVDQSKALFSYLVAMSFRQMTFTFLASVLSGKKGTSHRVDELGEIPNGGEASSLVSDRRLK